MAGYEVRTLASLSSGISLFFTQSLPGAIALVLPNTFRVIGKVLALLGQEHELRRAWLYDQIFASRAGALWLARHGFELGLAQEPASAASGTILAASSHGLVVPEGLVFVSGSGATYTTLAGATTTGNVVALPVEADAAGAAGNLGAGFPLTLAPNQDVPDGFGPSAAVDGAGLAGGAGAETLEGFRARILRRKRAPPQGGSALDYATWAEEALGPGILRRAYVDSFLNDTRSVWLCFTVTDQPDGIPSDAQVALVQAYCDDPVRRPVTARVFALKPLRLPVDVAISGLSPDTLDVRAAVEDEILATFADRAEVGTSTAVGFSRSWIDEAISRATGEDRHELAAPATTVIVTAGYLPVPGAIAYV
ncbi:baseplate J/gp47 family protein [uncultured Methylobacterium sp.]|uniref:baseplate J/gp47 family protein n=1 Tax=uncultured Methylobacterium sp. TaxID=157278 RepID=UPI0035CA541A